MPIKMEVKMDAWSWSRWNAYRQCPLKAKLKFIDKVQEPGSTAMDKGNAVHKMAEAFASKAVPEVDKRDGLALEPYQPIIKAAAKGKLPEPFKNFTEAMQALRKVGPLVEQEWAFDVNWKPTSWFGREAWLRVKMDAHFLKEKESILPVIDHKTGKIYKEDGELQLELYGLAGLLMYPAVKMVQAQLWYHDQPRNDENPATHTYERTQLPELKKLWEKRVKPMFADRSFKPRPGSYCRWCHFRKSNGGPCKF